MKVYKVYADTSVFGGVFDIEFLPCSEIFFEQVEAGRFILVTSALVEDEILKAPKHVQDFFSTTVANAEVAVLSQEVFNLRQAYLKADILTPKSIEDATHVALASVSRCDIIVSWNLKHIVNKDKIPEYNAVNVNNGYSHLKIISPKEVVKNAK